MAAVRLGCKAAFILGWKSAVGLLSQAAVELRQQAKRSKMDELAKAFRFEQHGNGD